MSVLDERVAAAATPTVAERPRAPDRSRRRLGGTSRELFRDIPRSKVVLVLVLSGLGGLFEAALLILIVQVTISATGEEGSGSAASSGLLGQALGGLSIAEGVGLGSGCALLSIVLQLAATRMMMRAAAVKLDADRARIVRTFYSSSVTDQSTLSAGAVPDLSANSANRVADAVFLNGQAASAWVNLAVLVLAAFAASPWMAIAMIVVALLVGVAFAPITRIVTRHSRGWVLRGREYNGFLSIYTRMFLEVRVFGVWDRVEDLALERSRATTEAWRRGRTLQLSTPVAFRNLVLLLGFLSIGAVAMIAPDSVGSVAITALLLLRGLVYVQTLLANRQSVKALATNLTLIESTLDELQPDAAEWGTSPLPEITSIELRGASHAYRTGSETFAGVDLLARRGDFVAVLGPSGSGKTTLLKVLMRTVEPSAGQLLVNDRPVTTYRQSDWYASVAYLSQEVRLIPGTVADNIRFFRDASDDAVRRSARAASLELDGRAFPEGLETMVEQEGGNLSGGQRQRIGLARCLLLDPQLLVLDEPTSALDPVTEQAIMTTIAGLHDQMLVVMVTHRESTLAFTDVHYRMDEGRLTRLERTDHE
jgi:ATP-binding cassette subfamily B protein